MAELEERVDRLEGRVNVVEIKQGVSENQTENIAIVLGEVRKVVSTLNDTLIEFRTEFKNVKKMLIV